MGRSGTAAPIGLAALAAALFGSAAPASKLLLASLSAFQLAGLLYLGAALAMLPWAVGSGRVRRTRLDHANGYRLAGVIVAGGVIGPLLLLAGLRMAPAASVSLLLNLEMAATAVLGAALFHEPLTRAGWFGVAGIVGAGALLSGGDWPAASAGLLVAGACVCWGVDNHLTALIDGITPASSTFWKGLAAGGVNLLIGLAVAPLVASRWQLGAALVVGAFSYGVSIALYIRAAHQLGAVRAQAVFTSAPFVGAALSFALLGEPITGETLLAAALLAVSVWVLFGGVHAHLHHHSAVEHVHAHRHDDGHHDHVHADTSPTTPHSHLHRHEELVHAHPHWPDLHHRHRH